MNKSKELKIPLAILERKIKDNTFSLLRFFVEFFGAENARAILSFIENGNEEDFNSANEKIFSSLRDRFVFFKKLSNQEIQRILLEFYLKANLIVEGLIDSSFPGMELELGLLNTTTVPTMDLAKRISIIFSNGETTDRYKYDLLRQDIMSLLLLELSKYNHLVRNSEKLNKLQGLFEENFFLGKIGEINTKRIYSIHDNETNFCLGTFSSKEDAYIFLNKQLIVSTAHIKKHKWNMREVSDVGNTLVNMRTKSDFSIIRKVVHNAIKSESIRPKIEVGIDSDLLDITGFMFVVPNGQRHNMLKKVTNIIEENYPIAGIVSKNVVKRGRGQSSKVSFLRVLIYLDQNITPIEVMVMDQVEYMNYRFEIEQAHELFSLRKSISSANLLFPEDVYHYDNAEVEQYRLRQKEEIITKLKVSNRV